MLFKDVTEWLIVLDFPGVKAVTGAFQAVLELAPISRSAVAKELGVSQPTVSRWSNGTASPDLRQIKSGLEVVENRMLEIQERVSHCRRAVDLAERAIALHRQSSKKRDPKLSNEETKVVRELWEMIEDKEYWNEFWSSEAALSELEDRQEES